MRATLLNVGIFFVITVTGCTILAGLDETYVFEPPQISAATGGDPDGGVKCSPGTIQECYVGPMDTLGVGICKAGSQTCTAEETGYGECIGALTPVIEDCTTVGEDENCDGEPLCDGSPLWSRAFGDTSEQYGARVAVSGSGELFLTGHFGGTIDFGGGKLASAGTADVFLASLGADSEHLWSKRFGDAAEQYVTAIDVGADGSVAIAGYFEGTIDFGGGPLVSKGETDAFVAKFDRDGGHLWSHSLGGAGSQVARSLRVDIFGNVVITGDYQGTMDLLGDPLTSLGMSDIFIAMLIPEGELLWSDSISGPDNEFSKSVATDPSSGDIVLVGSYGSGADLGDGVMATTNGGLDVFLSKRSLAGAHKWSVTFGSPMVDEAMHAVIDGKGSLLVTGDFTSEIKIGYAAVLTSKGSTDIYVAKFDTDGGYLWSREFGGTDAQHVRSIAVDALDNMVLTGDFYGEFDLGGPKLTSPSGSDIFLAKLDSEGNHIWSKRAGDANNQESHDVAIDGRGYVFVTGYFSGILELPGSSIASIASQGLAPDVFAAKFTP